MRRPRSSGTDCGGQVSLPAGVEELLIDVVADGFVLYCCGPKTAPNAVVASYEWEYYVDLLTIRDFDRVTTARVPTRGGVDNLRSRGRGLGLSGPVTAGAAGPAEPGAPSTSRRSHRRLPGAHEPARSPRPATPDDDPTPLTRPRRSAGCPPDHRDDDPQRRSRQGCRRACRGRRYRSAARDDLADRQRLFGHVASPRQGGSPCPLHHDPSSTSGLASTAPRSRSSAGHRGVVDAHATAHRPRERPSGNHANVHGGRDAATVGPDRVLAG
jgi:hypothetical protein